MSTQGLHSHRISRLLLDRFPLYGQNAEESEACHCHGNIPSFRQRLVVCDLDCAEETRGNVVLQISCPDVDHYVGIDSRSIRDNTLYKLVGEDVLCHGNEDRTAHKLEEHHHCGCNWDITSRHDCLGRHQGLLHAEPDPEAVHDFVAYPLRMCRRGFPSRKKSGANRLEDCRQIKEGNIISTDGCSNP